MTSKLKFAAHHNEENQSQQQSFLKSEFLAFTPCLDDEEHLERRERSIPNRAQKI
jgi:hypothetical protein